MELVHKKSVLGLCIILHAITASKKFAIALSNETDRLALLTFKDHITSDPSGVLSSWNDSIHFCQWDGVACGKWHERVTTLNLEAKSLVGTLSPSIGNLTFLHVLNLGSNNFQGGIPPEIANLFRLQVLNLSLNSFGGKIPVNMSHCRNLKLLNFNNNGLTGMLPSELGFNSNLQILLVASNNLIGSIPPSLGNISSLSYLVLMINNFDGSIPYELGQLKSLKYLQLAGNILTGTLPSSLYNLTFISQLSVAGNKLQGNFPPDIGLSFPNVQWLSIGGNYFTGSIPDSISNATKLLLLDASQNEFIGTIPESIRSLQDFQYLNVGLNHLGKGEVDGLSFLTSLTNCSSLQVLGLNDNNFEGVLPGSIGNLSTQLRTLTFGGNRIYGSINVEIENLVNLSTLGLGRNTLSGSIPYGIGKLQRLQLLELSRNSISGNIPSSIGNMTMMIQLLLDDNALEGNIPTSLGNCQYLQVLNLSQNNLNGSIPKQILNIPHLSISLNLAHNSLSGSLPPEIGNLKNLVELDISKNNLSSKIPEALGNCITLEHLYIDHNSFKGNIPQYLNNLKSLQALDLSHNNLTGKIPIYLEKLPLLQYLNLSFNNLEGEVPNKGVFRNLSATSIIGNKELCGGIPALRLPACHVVEPRKKHRRSIVLKVSVVVGVTCTIMMLTFFTILCYVRSRKNLNSSTSSSVNQVSRLSYMQLFKATEGFSTANLIGRGSHGSVYRGIMHNNGKEVAVKVFNLSNRGSLKSFMAECNALKNIRHRNLIKIITCCSGVDFKGNDFKAIVFEFMPNGSLENWLHPAEQQQQWKHLNFIKRLNVAIDVASALEYLHFSCRPPVVHCDLKPSNILLDSEMNAYVGDFGVARLLAMTTTNFTRNEASSSCIKGTIGYVAPEYAMGSEVSIYGDVYSYGILLLEMFTGKRPTDDMFENGSSLYEFAKIGLTGQPLKIVDPLLLQERKGHNEDKNREEKGNSVIDDDETTVRNKLVECLVLVIKTGVICSMESPKERMDISETLKKMQAIRDYFLGSHNLRYAF